MNLLLDTCTFLWLIGNPARLSAHAAQCITDPANTCYLSTVSAWEIAILYTLGRISLAQAPEVFVPAQRANHRIDPLPLSEEAALHLAQLPPLHRNPFDRMLICQALVHNLVLVTPDVLMQQYPQVRTQW